MARASQRERILAAAVAYYSETANLGVSLRELAPHLGTSHRMLLYYFGTKAELLNAVWAELQAGFYEQMPVPEGETVDLAKFLAAYLGAYRDLHLRRFREPAAVPVPGAGIPQRMTGLALADPDNYGVLASENLNRGLAVAESFVQLAEGDVPTGFATFAVAAVRGLELDLAISGDVDRFAAGFECLIDAVRQLLAEGTAARPRRGLSARAS